MYINDANWKDVWFYSNGEILGFTGTIKVFFYDNLLLIITILGIGLFVGYKVSFLNNLTISRATSGRNIGSKSILFPHSFQS